MFFYFYYMQIDFIDSFKKQNNSNSGVPRSGLDMRRKFRMFLFLFLFFYCFSSVFFHLDDNEWQTEINCANFGSLPNGFRMFSQKMLIQKEHGQRREIESTNGWSGFASGTFGETIAVERASFLTSGSILGRTYSLLA